MTTTQDEQVVVRQRWWVLGAVIALAVCVLVGFRVGQGSRVKTEEVECLSAQGTIGCTLKDGWDIAVPLDVAWSDAQGVFHDGGRPDCLPPTGRGAQGPVQVSWTEVEADGVGWRQVIWVGC